MSESVKKALLEIARLALFTGVSAFVASVSESVTKLEPSTTTVVLTVLLRFVDKWLYESGKAKKGLSRF